MTSGCAVVATESTDDVKELLGDGQRGVLVPLWDSYALAEAILRILWDKRLRANLIEAGIHYARNFSISSSVTLYEELLKSVL
jgi:glycosyltransferase involved in cell wall biosynthesis